MVSGKPTLRFLVHLFSASSILHVGKRMLGWKHRAKDLNR